MDWLGKAKITQETEKLRGKTIDDRRNPHSLPEEFIINLKAAKQIGTIPPNVLVRADRVIRWKNFGFSIILLFRTYQGTEDSSEKTNALVFDSVYAGCPQPAAHV
jgi:hypothetical protein